MPIFTRQYIICSIYFNKENVNIHVKECLCHNVYDTNITSPALFQKLGTQETEIEIIRAPPKMRENFNMHLFYF